jgi:hypothetical protein
MTTRLHGRRFGAEIFKTMHRRLRPFQKEIEEELLPVSVQTAYVQALSGRKEEAAEVYRMALAMKTTDAASQAVAAINLAAMVGPRGKGGGDAGKRIEKMALPNGTLTGDLAASLSDAGG